jgi:hypothetical protein
VVLYSLNVLFRFKMKNDGVSSTPKFSKKNLLCEFNGMILLWAGLLFLKGLQALRTSLKSLIYLVKILVKRD